MHRILVWTQKVDLHADLVIRELQAKGALVTRINGDDYPANKTASICFPGGTVTGGRNMLVGADTPFDAVWYRRRVSPVPSTHMSQQAKTFASDETMALLDGVLLLTRDSFWVNSFASAHVARNKPLQLSVAESCGLAIPPTLISNDPVAVRAFAARHDKIIYKPVYRGLVTNDDKQDELIFANILPEGALANADQEIRAAPGIYQAYIPKQLELRITVVGSQIFSCAIHSQEHVETREDWRHYHAELRHSVFPLLKLWQIYSYRKEECLMQNNIQPLGFRFLTTANVPAPTVNLTDGVQAIKDVDLDTLTAYANTLTFTPGNDNDFD